jgi:predicted ABC-type ATPase
MPEQKKIIIIAGPNGAGKTTFAKAFLPNEANCFVELYFLALSNAEFAIERVAHRVKQGGHHIPDDVVRRWYTAGLKNFHEVYKPLVNKWTLFDNDGIDTNAVDWG